ncbi:MAG TPA: right-handed parallel beta-helix repeat-containing protein, partial [bacterium]|nr:right-handed parallel beta-helix repeat-containing protein [bacterium]
DTLAPCVPDSVTASGALAGCTVSWRTTGVNEESGLATTDTAGFRIYRSLSADTNVWQLIGSTAAAARAFLNSNTSMYDQRYYRVTAYDNHAGWLNESYYSDSIASARQIYTGPWYVSSDTGSDTAGTGLAANPYRTIFKAMQAASSGETIQLYACSAVWSESVVVTKDTVTLAGMGRNASVIRPPASQHGISTSGIRTGFIIRDLAVTGITGSYNAVNLDGAVRAAVRGCSFATGAQYGIRLNSCTGITLYNNYVTGFTGEQIRAEAAAYNNVFDSNYVFNSESSGIMVLGDSNMMTGNRIERHSYGAYVTGDTCAFIGNFMMNAYNYGLYGESCNNGIIYNNVFDSNAREYSGNYRGAVHLCNSSYGTTIDSNTIINGVGAGIVATGVWNLTLTRNRVENNRYYGIRMWYDTGSVIRGNYVRNNAGYGADLINVFADSVSDNVFDSNGGWYGVSISASCTAVMFDSNTVTNQRSNNSSYVLLNAYGDSLIITNNCISNSDGFGLATNGVEVTLRGNRIGNCQNYGMYLKGNRQVAFNNYIDSCASCLLYLTAASNCWIDSNTLTRGGNVGVNLAADVDSNAVRNNRVAVTAGYGFWLAGDSCIIAGNDQTSANSGSSFGYFVNGVANTLYGNRADSNGADGFRLGAAANNCVLDSNLITGCLGYGIDIEGDSVGVYGNRLQDNAGGGMYLNGADSVAVVGNRLTNSSGVGVRCSGLYGAVVTGNDIDSCLMYGVQLSSVARSRVAENRIARGSIYGLMLDGATSCLVERNEVSGYSNHAVYLGGSAAADTLVKNNIASDSGKYITSSVSGWQFDCSRNWWGSADSAVLSAGMNGTASGNLSWQPYRFGVVDTAAGMDTIAPCAPDSVSAAGTANGCTISWSTGGLNEEIGTATADTAGFRI